jgi:MFS family permease
MMLLPVTLLCGGQFLVVLDATIVAVALPAIRHSLALSHDGLQWVVTAYALTFGGLLVATGRAGDLVGHRRLLQAGLVTFGGASLACALAPSGAALIAGRAVQGAGAAMEAPAALALVATLPDRRRGVARLPAAAAAGGASGWVLGGVLVEAFGWPAVFAVNVPLCAAGALLAPRVLAERRGAARRLDVAGSTAVTAGLALLVLGLSEQPAALPAAGAAFAAFAWIERRASDPILPGWTLRRPGFARANGVALALTATTTPAMFLAILYQQEVLGRSALEAGLWCAPFNLAVIGGSLLGRPGAMAGGLAGVGAGTLALATLRPAALPVGFVLMGAGLGCASVASTASGTAALPDGEQGIASGVLNASAQIGSAVGVAVIVGLGYRAGFVVAAVVALTVAKASKDRRERAAVHRPGGAGHVRRALRAQEDDDGGDLVGLAEAAERDA